MNAPRALSHLFHRFRREENGVALVEFALLLPVFLLLFAVTVEATRLVWGYNAAASGVRDASRYLARAAALNSCDGGGNINDFTGTLSEIIQNNLDGESVLPAVVTVTNVTPTLTCVAGPYRVSPAPFVRVTATLEFDVPMSGLFSFAGSEFETYTVTVSDQHRVFGT